MRTIEPLLKLHPSRIPRSSKSHSLQRLSVSLLLDLSQPFYITTTVFEYMLHRFLSVTTSSRVAKPHFWLTLSTVLRYYRLRWTLNYKQCTPVCRQIYYYVAFSYTDINTTLNSLKYYLNASSDFTHKLHRYSQTQSLMWKTPLTSFLKPKITTSACIRFRKNYSISFLLKPSSTGVYQTIWSCRVSCFYRLVSPTYSKIHIKKYKKFLDILSTKVFTYWKNAKPVTNFLVVIPDVLDVIPSRTFGKYSKNIPPHGSTNALNFVGSGCIKLHKDFFYSLKIRRSLPRRIRRKVLSKKVGRLWLK